MEGLARLLVSKRLTNDNMFSSREGVRSVDGRVLTDIAGIINVGLTISCNNNVSVEFFEHGYDAEGEDT